MAAKSYSGFGRTPRPPTSSKLLSHSSFHLSKSCFAGYAKEHFLFKDESTYKGDKEYRLAMSMLCGYTMAGKNKNDDVVDSIAMLVDYSESFRLAKVEVIKRPF